MHIARCAVAAGARPGPCHTAGATRRHPHWPPWRLLSRHSRLFPAIFCAFSAYPPRSAWVMVFPAYGRDLSLDASPGPRARARAPARRPENPIFWGSKMVPL